MKNQKSKIPFKYRTKARANNKLAKEHDSVELPNAR